MAKTAHAEVGAPTRAPESGDQQLQGTQQISGNDSGREVQNVANAGRDARQHGVAHYGRDPFAMMRRLSSEMDELFDALFHGRPLARAGADSRLHNLWAPEVEIREEANQLRVSVDLPGVPKENVKIDIHDGMLTIQGERREERTDGGEQQGFRRSERRYGSFYRGIPLPEGADTDNAQAQMKEGVLEVIVPVAAKQARRLEIQ